MYKQPTPSVEAAPAPGTIPSSTHAQRLSIRSKLVEGATKPTRCELCKTPFDDAMRAPSGRLGDGRTISKLVHSLCDLSELEDALCDPDLVWVCLVCSRSRKDLAHISVADLIKSIARKPMHRVDIHAKVAETTECTQGYVDTQLCLLTKAGALERKSAGVYVATEPARRRIKAGAFAGLSHRAAK